MAKGYHRKLSTSSNLDFGAQLGDAGHKSSGGNSAPFGTAVTAVPMLNLKNCTHEKVLG